MYLLATALLALSVVAWQNTPPLSLTVTVDPEVASTDETLTVTLTVSNTGESPLDAVVVRVHVPQGTELEDAQAAEGWTVLEPDADDGVVEYHARDSLATGQRAQLVLTLLVQQAAGDAILLDRYTATAEQLSTPVEGQAVTIRVGATPTPSPTAAPATATRTPTAAETTPSPSPSVTPSVTATATAAPTPTATITLGPVELPPTATPTPNLSSEQVVVGTITVSIFVAIVVVLIVLAVVWVIRAARREGGA